MQLLPLISARVKNTALLCMLLLLTVLAFNLVGDGLRDAFDPKMKR